MLRRIQASILIATSAIIVGSGIAISERIVSKAVDSLLPPTSKVNFFSRPGTIELYASNGEIIQKIGPLTREKVSKDDMPKVVKEAFIAAEDRRFYQHKGVDLWSISRALITNIKKKSVIEGGSTITQQLARMIFLTQDRNLSRKLNEIALAYKLERNLTKEEILEQYLNNVYLGSSAYGISDAAWIYFSKTPKGLTLEEAALIAGLAPAPSFYSPLVNADLAMKRRSIVLEKMKLEKFISTSEFEIALNKPLKLKPATPKYLRSKAPFFTSYVSQVLPNLLSKEQLEIGGLKIQTTLNLDWQLKAKAILNSLTPINSEGAIVSIEPKSGLIRVLVGGKNFSDTQFNRATQALRSPGSTFKLFPYLAAINAGFQPEDLLFDTPRCWYGYCPKNFGNKYFGEVSITEAFANSLNTVAVDLLEKVGFENVITIANSLGIGKDEKLGHYYPMAIGAYEATVLSMTAAYAGIANRGLFITPSAIKEIKDVNNEVIWHQERRVEQGVRAVSEDVADTMNWMLRKVVTEGSGVAALIKDRQVAGKTGTSEGNRDLWFIGSIPQLTTTVWFGKDTNETTEASSGDAAFTWKEFIQQLEDELEVLEFPKRPTYTKSFVKINSKN